MASIVARKRMDGSFGYTALIRIKRGGVVVHSEAKTFNRKAAAKVWAAERESLLRRDPGAADAARHRKLTVGHLVSRYLSDREAIEPLGRTKKQHLLQILGFDLAGRPALLLTPDQIIEHVRQRRLMGAGPATVHNDIVWLRVVWRYARTALGVPVRLEVLDDAGAVCQAERLTGRSAQRKRRPTDAELRRLDAHFQRLGQRAPPMRLILWFAIYSCRRQAEIFALRLSDFDRAQRVWTVRDIKHPGGSRGHHREMRVTDALLRVIEAILTSVPRDPAEDRLLPFNAKSIGAFWTRTLKVLGIEDLHFHDLRHEGCSRLAEAGWTIPEIQQVSLHESWGSLQIYVNRRPRQTARVEFEDY